MSAFMKIQDLVSSLKLCSNDEENNCKLCPMQRYGNDCIARLQREALRTIVALLKRRDNRNIPKPVTHSASIEACCTCPMCGNVVDEFDTTGELPVRILSSHCKFCGQALDWSEEIAKDAQK